MKALPRDGVNVDSPVPAGASPSMGKSGAVKTECRRVLKGEGGWRGGVAALLWRPAVGEEARGAKAWVEPG